ncbi:MAG: hypothetical protein IRZ05_18440 [Micromonosporaceae bacterium]|nr:hypothetical protein [Micromonosporaceae bacterium]
MVAALSGPRPSLAEYVAADFGHAWDIWREVGPDGTHGDWVARELHPDGGAEPRELRAATIPDLVDMLWQVGS